MVLEGRRRQLEEELDHVGLEQHEASDAHRGRLGHLHQAGHVALGVLGDLRLAREAPALVELIVQVAVVGERALHVTREHLHPALAARASAAARRLDRQPGPVRRVEQRRALGHPDGLPARLVRDLDLPGHAVGSPPASRRLRRRELGTVQRDPVRAVLVAPEQQVGGEDRLARLDVQRVRDGGVHAGHDRHREERRVDAAAVRHAEGDVRGAAAHVHAELGAEQLHRLVHRGRRVGRSADRHRERVDDHVLVADAVVGGAFHDLARGRQAHLRIHRDAVGVVGHADHRGAESRDQRQQPLERVLLGRDGVDQHLALGQRHRGLEGLGGRGVDAQRHADDLVHGLHHRGEHRRLVEPRDAGVQIEHRCARFHLRERIALHGGHVHDLQLLGELRAPRRVDALADDAERVLVADRDLAAGTAQDRRRDTAHWATPTSFFAISTASGALFA